MSLVTGHPVTSLIWSHTCGFLQFLAAYGNSPTPLHVRNNNVQIRSTPLVSLPPPFLIIGSPIPYDFVVLL